MRRKPTVIHLIQSLDNGGCENFLLRVLPRVTEYHHVIITLARVGELADKFKAADISVVTLAQQGLFDRMARKQLRTLLNDHSPALVMTYLFHADFVGRLFVRRWGYTVVPSLRTTYNDRRYWVPRLFEWLTRGRVKAYLANSEAIKKYYSQHLGVNPGKITVIPNGLVLDEFGKSEKKSVLHKELQLPDDALVVTCVANLHLNKGHTYLLTAFDALFAKHPESHLLIVGDGETREALESQALESAAKSGIHFLGRRMDVPAILGLTDIFVLPTLFEGMSNALLEAAASRCAVITTDIPENRTMFDAAIFVPVKDSAELGQRLIDLADDPNDRNKAAIAIQDEVRNKYDIRVVADQLMAYYGEQVAHHG